MINGRNMNESDERSRERESLRKQKSERKRSLRWRKDFEYQRALYREIRASATDIFRSPNFYSTKSYIQHGNMTVNDHCVRVAAYSLALSKKLRISCSHRELIRGALLHDYFLYDWHDKDYVSPHKLHGFFHPGKALKNASEEYDLTPREKEIIRKHMWPLTVVPPTCREAWIVTMADKWCSLMETCHLHRGHGKILEKIKNQRMEESRQ